MSADRQLLRRGPADLATHRRAWRREMTTSELPDVVARTEADDGIRTLLLQALAELKPSQGTIVPDLAHL